MKTSRTLTVRLIIAAVILFGLIVLVSRRFVPRDPNAPPDGMILVHPQKLSEDSTTSHWRWTIIGDRKWAVMFTQAGQKEDAITLKTDNNMLHHFAGTGGSSVFTYEVKLEKETSYVPGVKSYREDISLHGNGGHPAFNRSNTVSSPIMQMKSLVTILVARDTIVRLPANISLAMVAGKTLKLHLSQ